MGHVTLARTARAHALRAAFLSWLALAAVLALMWLFPHRWFDVLLPIDGWIVVPVAMAVALIIVVALPLERVGGLVVADLRGRQAEGRLRNIADEVSIAIGEPAGRVLVHDSPIPNVGAFPTRTGGVVLATAGAVEQLRRDELEALVAAQLAGMRDRWCRVATRAELVWSWSVPLGFVSLLVAWPGAVFVAAAMLFAPRIVEVTRDLCADVAAVAATRHPAALASGLRRLAPSAGMGDQQRLTRSRFLPVNPFLVLPRRITTTTSVSRTGRPTRTWTHVDEIVAELRLRSDRAEALAAGADPRTFTGREYRRRWARLGAPTEASWSGQPGRRGSG